MNTSESLKKAVDDFGRLSFVLETYVKLYQTGDHTDIAEKLLQACIDDTQNLYKSLLDLKPVEYEQRS